MSKKIQKTEQQLLLTDIKQLIQSSRQRAMVAVNTEITQLYWNVGNHIRQYLTTRR